jgi:hypothetical protein
VKRPETSKGIHAWNRGGKNGKGRRYAAPEIFATAANYQTLETRFADISCIPVGFNESPSMFSRLAFANWNTNHSERLRTSLRRNSQPPGLKLFLLRMKMVRYRCIHTSEYIWGSVALVADPAFCLPPCCLWYNCTLSSIKPSAMQVLAILVTTR